MSNQPDEAAKIDDCVVPPPLDKEELHAFVLGMNEHQAREISEYVEWQCNAKRESELEECGATELEEELVEHAEKIKSERVHGIDYDAWDVHTNQGRWWVITSPRNRHRRHRRAQCRHVAHQRASSASAVGGDDVRPELGLGAGPLCAVHGRSLRAGLAAGRCAVEVMMGFAKQTLKSSPGGGGGPFAKRMVEGCHPIETATPLRQGCALPPPLPGEDGGCSTRQVCKLHDRHRTTRPAPAIPLSRHSDPGVTSP